MLEDDNDGGIPFLEDDNEEEEMRPPPPQHQPLVALPSGSFSRKNPALALLWRSVSCLGVVFGDLGTSPIYSFRECFAEGGLAATNDNVHAVLAMIIWSLFLVVSVKYLFIFCFVEGPNGAGGTLALVGRLKEVLSKRVAKFFLLPLSMLAISLFLADSLITPGVSVLSSVEGLGSLYPPIKRYIPLIAIVILACLFFAQQWGTGTIGGVFGPIMVAQFATMGTLGLATICIFGDFSILNALNPGLALTFVWRDPLGAWLALQSVVLSIAGAEALYTDMGHFGRTPIMLAWQSLVLPCLILNYMGQGVILLTPGMPDELRENPFFALAPTWWIRIGLIFLSTAATLIGSQAVISGAFATIEQAMYLDMLPSLAVFQTGEHGQIYLPAVNFALAIGVMALVALFQRSSRLASAYGLAVVGAMLMDSLLMFAVLRYLWHWRTWLAVLIAGVFVTLDSTYLISALGKIPSGGWIPLLLASGVFFVLSTWIHVNYSYNSLTIIIKDQII